MFGSKLLSFYRTNFTSLIIYENNFINITNTELINLDFCNFSQSYLLNGNFLYSFNTTLNIMNSFFINNTIEQTNKAFTYCLIRIGSSMNLSISLFKNNRLINSSLLFIENDDITSEKLVNISNKVVFFSNTETLEMPLGFAIIGLNITTILSNNVIFQNNYADKSFIFISNTLKTVEIKDLIFTQNFGFEFIALQLIRNISIDSLKCLNNNDFSLSYYEKDSLYSNPGNCLSIVNYIDLKIINCTFSNNFAISTLTGVLLEHTLDISLLGTSLDDNINALLENVECSNNIVNATQKVLVTSGNCFLLINLGSITMINNNVSYNVINVDLKSKFSGNPCLLSLSNDNNLIILNSIFKGNQAYSECSCINFHGHNFILKNTSFIENRSIKIKIGDSEPSFYVANEGGCLNLGASNITMYNVLIFNSSAMKGAGIFFHNKNSKPFQTLFATNFNILKNEGTQTSGMEFDATLSLGDFIFSNCTINENKVDFYGVVSTFYYSNFNIYFYYNDISYNWGVSAGAAFSFCHFGGKIYFNHTTFIQNVLNQSVFLGGAAMMAYGFTKSTFIYVKDSYFLENYSSTKGGAIQISYGQVYILDSIFIDNFAQIGGVISLSVFSPGGFQNVVIKNRFKVNQGGGIHCADFAKIE